MAKKSLSDWLEEIGGETVVDNDDINTTDGSYVVRTKDELLARQIWQRALGWEETSEDDTGTHVTIHSPDPRAQVFIIERREGKMVTPSDDKSLTPLDRVSDMVQKDINDAAEAAVSDDEAPPENLGPNVETDETVSEHPDSLDGPEDRDTDTKGSVG